MADFNARPSGCPVEIVAHRGASAEAPENTRAAVELAWTIGADAVEIDVQLSQDGHLAVIHDATLDRTAGIDRKVSDMLMRDLQRIDVGSRNGQRWPGETIPTLPEILATIPIGRRLFVELKDAPGSDRNVQIINALERDLAAMAETPGSVVVISFDPDLLHAAKQRLPAFKAFLVVEQKLSEPCTDESSDRPSNWDPSIGRIIEVATGLGIDGVDLSNTAAVSSSAVERIRRAGFSSCIWTVNSIADAQRLVLAGVDSLTTDDPRRIRAGLQQPAEK